MASKQNSFELHHHSSEPTINPFQDFFGVISFHNTMQLNSLLNSIYIMFNSLSFEDRNTEMEVITCQNTN